MAVGEVSDGLPDWVSSDARGVLPFAYESTGVETRFTNTLDPDPRSRQVFWFHRPETLAGWIDERDATSVGADAARIGCGTCPSLVTPACGRRRRARSATSRSRWRITARGR